MTIDDDITMLRKRVAQLQHEAELAAAELRGLERARKYVLLQQRAPVPEQPIHLPDNSAPRAKRGGRQPGAISERWKLLFGDLSTLDGDFDDGAVVQAVEDREGRKMKVSEVRRLFDGYAKQGLVTIQDRGLYRITSLAMKRFGLKAPKNEAAGTPNKDAPTASAQEQSHEGPFG